MVKKLASSNPKENHSKEKSNPKGKKLSEVVKQKKGEKEGSNKTVVDSNDIKKRVQNILNKTIGFSKKIENASKQESKIKKIRQKNPKNGNLTY